MYVGAWSRMTGSWVGACAPQSAVPWIVGCSARAPTPPAPTVRAAAGAADAVVPARVVSAPAAVTASPRLKNVRRWKAGWSDISFELPPLGFIQGAGSPRCLRGISEHET